jgi:hypothetical protein
MDRRLKALTGRQVMRLLDEAKNCGDAKLQADLLAMAEEWLLEAMVQRALRENDPRCIH